MAVMVTPLAQVESYCDILGLLLPGPQSPADLSAIFQPILESSKFVFFQIRLLLIKRLAYS